MTRCSDDDNIEYADTNDDQVGDGNDDISESYHIFIIFIKTMVKLHRRKANISAHMQTGMIEVDFGLITNAGITMIPIYHQ